MIVARARAGDQPAVALTQPDRAELGAEFANAVQLEPEASGDGVDVCPARSGGGEEQLVVVTAAEQAAPRQCLVGAGFAQRGERQCAAIDDRAGGGGQRRMKGSNLRIKVKLTLEEIANGVEKKVKVKRKVQAAGVSYKTCGTCNGSGQVLRVTNTILGRMQTATTCPTCGGAGQSISSKPNNADAQGMILEDETVSIKIPAGVVDGMQLKVSGKGNDAPGNGIPGDLIVAIEEVEHEFLKREGENLHYDLYISVAEAALGVSKDIEAIGGKLRIKLEEGIQSGKILRLKGKGIPNINSYGNGDLLVHINVWTPKKLDREQKEFFEKMLTNENFIPNPEKSDKSFFEKVKDMFS